MLSAVTAHLQYRSSQVMFSLSGYLSPAQTPLEDYKRYLESGIAHYKSGKYIFAGKQLAHATQLEPKLLEQKQLEKFNVTRALYLVLTAIKADCPYEDFHKEWMDVLRHTPDVDKIIDEKEDAKLEPNKKMIREVFLHCNQLIQKNIEKYLPKDFKLAPKAETINSLEEKFNQTNDKEHLLIRTYYASEVIARDPADSVTYLARHMRLVLANISNSSFLFDISAMISLSVNHPEKPGVMLKIASDKLKKSQSPALYFVLMELYVEYIRWFRATQKGEEAFVKEYEAGALELYKNVTSSPKIQNGLNGDQGSLFSRATFYELKYSAPKESYELAIALDAFDREDWKESRQMFRAARLRIKDTWPVKGLDVGIRETIAELKCGNGDERVRKNFITWLRTTAVDLGVPYKHIEFIADCLLVPLQKIPEGNRSTGNYDKDLKKSFEEEQSGNYFVAVRYYQSLIFSYKKNKLALEHYLGMGYSLFCVGDKIHLPLMERVRDFAIRLAMVEYKKSDEVHKADRISDLIKYLNQKLEQDENINRYFFVLDVCFRLAQNLKKLGNIPRAKEVSEFILKIYEKIDKYCSNPDLECARKVERLHAIVTAYGYENYIEDEKARKNETVWLQSLPKKPADEKAPANPAASDAKANTPGDTVTVVPTNVTANARADTTSSSSDERDDDTTDSKASNSPDEMKTASTVTQGAQETSKAPSSKLKNGFRLLKKGGKSGKSSVAKRLAQQRRASSSSDSSADVGEFLISPPPAKFSINATPVAISHPEEVGQTLKTKAEQARRAQKEKDDAIIKEYKKSLQQKRAEQEQKIAAACREEKRKAEEAQKAKEAAEQKRIEEEQQRIIQTALNEIVGKIETETKEEKERKDAVSSAVYSMVDIIEAREEEREKQKKRFEEKMNAHIKRSSTATCAVQLNSNSAIPEDLKPVLVIEKLPEKLKFLGKILCNFSQRSGEKFLIIGGTVRKIINAYHANSSRPQDMIVNIDDIDIVTSAKSDTKAAFDPKKWTHKDASHLCDQEIYPNDSYSEISDLTLKSRDLPTHWIVRHNRVIKNNLVEDAKSRDATPSSVYGEFFEKDGVMHFRIFNPGAVIDPYLDGYSDIQHKPMRWKLMAVTEEEKIAKIRQNPLHIIRLIYQAGKTDGVVFESDRIIIQKVFRETPKLFERSSFKQANDTLLQKIKYALTKKVSNDLEKKLITSEQVSLFKQELCDLGIENVLPKDIYDEVFVKKSSSPKAPITKPLGLTPKKLR